MSKKTISATSKGIAFIDSLPIEEMKSAELTAKWEQRLHKIEKGEDNLDQFIKDVEDQTRKWVAQIDSGVSKSSISASTTSIGTCPVCGKGIIVTKWGFGCSGYKEGCKFTISKEVAGKKLTESQVKKLLSKRKTDLIKGFKSKAGKDFSAYLALNDENKVVFEFQSRK